MHKCIFKVRFQKQDLRYCALDFETEKGEDLKLFVFEPNLSIFVFSLFSGKELCVMQTLSFMHCIRQFRSFVSSNDLKSATVDRLNGMYKRKNTKMG